MVAKETGSSARGYFCDQFENLANFDAHYNLTGPEIYDQMDGRIDAFIMGIHLSVMKIIP